MKYLCLILVLSTLMACTNKVIEKPENLIPEDKMVNIYFDVALFNAAQNSGYDKFKEHSIDGPQYIYSKYNIDSMQLVTSGNYYAAKPVVYEKIYDRVEEKLDSLKKAFDQEIGTGEGEQDEEEAEPDSLDPQKEVPADSVNKPGDSL